VTSGLGRDQFVQAGEILRDKREKNIERNALESLGTSQRERLVSIMTPVSVLWPNGQRAPSRGVRHVGTEGHFKGLFTHEWTLALLERWTNRVRML